jgi:hypothetical protein
MPGSRLEIVEGAGHFLPLSHADALEGSLRDFLNTTEAAHMSTTRWHDVLAGQTAAGAAAAR